MTSWAGMRTQTIGPLKSTFSSWTRPSLKFRVNHLFGFQALLTLHFTVGESLSSALTVESHHRPPHSLQIAATAHFLGRCGLHTWRTLESSYVYWASLHLWFPSHQRIRYRLKKSKCGPHKETRQQNSRVGLAK